MHVKGNYFCPVVKIDLQCTFGNICLVSFIIYCSNKTVLKFTKAKQKHMKIINLSGFAFKQELFHSFEMKRDRWMIYLPVPSIKLLAVKFSVNSPSFAGLV